MQLSGKNVLLASAFALCATIGGGGAVAMMRGDSEITGYDITPTGLTPRYPAGFECPHLTSLYASWIDVDGSRRDEIHSGVDGGRLGDWILAPGPGIVKASWRADWGWGSEGALMILHSREELNLSDGPPFYLSEFDHLRHRETRRFKPGQRIARGEKLARVFRPGGKEKYLPEVHWEVWELDSDDELTWKTNKFDGRYWTSPAAHLIDPLYMLGRETTPQEDKGVALTPFIEGKDYSSFRGFTYILPCTARHRSSQTPTSKGSQP